MGKKILLIELAGIGDAILSSAAIKNLRRCYADSSIYFLTYSGPAQILKNSPYLDRVFIIKREPGNIRGNISVLRQLRSMDLDVAVNLYQHYTLGGAMKIALLLKFIRPKKTLGRNTDGKGFFYDIKIEDTINTKRQDVEYKLDLLQALGCDANDRRLEVWFDDAEVKKIGEFFKDNYVLDADMLIGINPGAHRLTHRWDWQNFSRLAEALSERYKPKIVITGARNEHWLAQRISQNMSVKPIDSTGKLSITQLAALIKRCNLYITNDTGPMHIANALGTPLVAIMGPGVMKTAPYQKENYIILRKDVECAPCYKNRCKDMRCLNLITVDEVLEACKKLLKR